MKATFNRIANLGIDNETPEADVRYIRLLNILLICVILILVMVMPGVLLILPAYEFVYYERAIYLALNFVILFLNAKKFYLTARLMFNLVGLFDMILVTLAFGQSSYFHLFMLMVIIAAFFIFPVRQKVYMYSMVGTTAITMVLLQTFCYQQAPWLNVTQETVSFLEHNIIVSLIAMTIAFSFYNYVIFHEAETKLQQERKKSENLLHNILPEKIANRLKDKNETIADGFSTVSILFADIVGFTALSKKTPPEKLVAMLNNIFSKFDDLAEKYGLEKIKTIGDAYMIAAGIPEARDDHAEAIAKFALEMGNLIQQFDYGEPLQLRIGINSGPVVAGVIGKKKFIYDLWGDAVNTASRMESHGMVNKIQVTQSTYDLLKDKFNFEIRGPIEIKGKGQMQTYFLKGHK